MFLNDLHTSLDRKIMIHLCLGYQYTSQRKMAGMWYVANILQRICQVNPTRSVAFGVPLRKF